MPELCTNNANYTNVAHVKYASMNLEKKLLKAA